MSNQSILVIDDEPHIRMLLNITLQSENYTVFEATTGEEGLSTITNHFNNLDLILLDLGMFGINGHEVLKHVRQWYSKPIIIISAQRDEQSILKALDSGADDFIVKPFHTQQLLARIKTILHKSKTQKNSPVVQFGDLTIDFVNRMVTKKNSELNLAPIEYLLLVLFIKHQGKLLTHDFILHQIWGKEHPKDLQSLHVFVIQLRKKIETDVNRSEFIIAESGLGYRFVGSVY